MSASKENKELLSKGSKRILNLLYEGAKFSTIYTLNNKEGEISAKLGISTQAYKLHLKRLKDKGYIRIGQGFVDITDKGLNAIGHPTAPAFILIKSPLNRKLGAKLGSKELKEIVNSVFKDPAEVEALIIKRGDDLSELLENHLFSSIDKNTAISKRQCEKFENRRKVKKKDRISVSLPKRLLS